MNERQFHKVRVSLVNQIGYVNKVFIDDKEIVNVREFSITAKASRSTVTITFFADVEGEFSGAQETTIDPGEGEP